MLFSNQRLSLYTFLFVVTAITCVIKYNSPLLEKSTNRKPLSESMLYKSLYEQETAAQSNSEATGSALDVDNLKNYSCKSNDLKKQTRRKYFLYVTQTESCLPRHFKRPDQLGPSEESYDILVLSYANLCTNIQYQYPNVKYLATDRNTTWSTGRNLLFKHIMKNLKKYLYYIFMDDDIELYFSEPYQFFHLENPQLQDKLQTEVTEKYLAFREQRMQRGNNAFREFEKFLLDFEPAVGLLNLCFKERQNCVSSFYPDIWAFYCSGRGPPPLPILSYSSFDGAFNAFHRDAIGHILPYRLSFENISWHDSQKYVVLLSDIKFQGQVLYHILLSAWGLSHRAYPRGTRWVTNWEPILAELRETEVPPKYHYKREVLPFTVTRRRFDEIRNPLPPNTPIVPYQHYEFNMTQNCYREPYMYPFYNDDCKSTITW